MMIIIMSKRRILLQQLSFVRRFVAAVSVPKTTIVQRNSSSCCIVGFASQQHNNPNKKNNNNMLFVAAGSSVVAVGAGAGASAGDDQLCQCCDDTETTSTTTKSSTTATTTTKNTSPPPPPTVVVTSTVSWTRRVLYRTGLWPYLPIPRLLAPHDPDLTLPRHLQQRRQRDDVALIKLQREVQQELYLGDIVSSSSSSADVAPVLTPAEKNRRIEKMDQLVKRMHGVLYGNLVISNDIMDHQQQQRQQQLRRRPPTPQERMDFLAQYGCTAWTTTALDVLCDVGERRGFVEIGAGHGQWARAVTERHLERRRRQQQEQSKQKEQQQQQQQQLDPNNSKVMATPVRPLRDFCLAYDNYSHLPLNPQMYHPKTQPHRDYFGQVQPIPNATTANNNKNKDNDNDDNDNYDTTRAQLLALLAQWRHRGRVLLLVYPGPDDDMAAAALQAYAALGPENDTVVYVGEGRGGANASDAFFNALEQGGRREKREEEADDEGSSSNDYRGGWILQSIVPVQPFGDKGYERMYVFKKAQ